MVSVGCNGLGYFEWIDTNLGIPAEHIGLEFYIPKPDGLKPNVTWVANTAGDMRSVKSQSSDLVFAGQTVEHLWYEELAGFFLESSRVTKPGGRLLFDSPNRRISNRLRWNHPEHTVELTPADAAALASLAGFEVIKMVGHWLCEAEDGALLPLEQMHDQGDWTLSRRISEGEHNPDRAFSWWCETVRSDREPNVPAVFDFARGLTRTHFSDRIGKLSHSQAPTEIRADGSTWAMGPQGWSGAVLFGPYAPLPAGRFMIRFLVDPYHGQSSPGWAEVFRTDESKVLARTELPASFAGGYVDLELDLDSTVFGLEFRLWSNGASALAARSQPEIYKFGIT